MTGECKHTQRFIRDFRDFDIFLQNQEDESDQ